MAELPIQPAVRTHDDEINLRDYWRVLVRQRRLIGGMVAVVTVLTVIVVLLLPKIYRSEATLIPLGQAQGGGLQSLMGELSGLLPLALGKKESPAERILAVLQSRTVAEDVIKNLDLLPRLFPNAWDAEKRVWDTDEPPTMEDGVEKLERLVSVTTDGKTNVVTIAALHTDPELAAQIANQYVAILESILNEKAFSLAKKNRLFLEAQLRKTRRALANAEEARQRFEEQYGIVALDAQAEAAIQTLSTLKAEIMAKEVQLQVLQRSVTGASQEVMLLQEEVRGLRSQLAQLQHGATTQSAVVSPPSQTFLALDEAPEVKLHYVRLEREARVQNELFVFLTQQLEQAKIDEAKDETTFQVLDHAIPPEKKFKPKRSLIVLLAIIVACFLGVLTAFFREYLDSTIRSREQIEQLIDVPLLATIPPTGSPQSRRGRRQTSHVEASPILSQPPGAPEVEALRYLYTRLQHYQKEEGIQTLLFTSTSPSDAEIATTLVNLARVAVSAGEKTLLVDSNLRQPVLHCLLDCPLVPGLADVLDDLQEWHKSIQTTQVDNLHFIPAGTVSPTSCAALGTPSFDALLTHCKETYTLILYSAPPVLSFSDAAVLSHKLDATCLVLTHGVSRLEAAIEVKKTLEAVQARIIGAVFIM